MAKKTTTTVTTVVEETDDSDQDILINILLDRSGSMGGHESDVIGHYNAYIKEQAALPGKATVSLVLFDSAYEEVYLGKDIKDVPTLTSDTYFVRGITAYLDALGRLIHSVDGLKNKPSKIVFVVNTDGYENASHEFTPDQIKKLITARQKKDWQFVFIGAGIDALSTGTRLGIRAASTYSTTNDSFGYNSSYTALNSATTSYRRGVGASGQVVNSMNMTTEPEPVVKEPKKKKAISK